MAKTTRHQIGSLLRRELATAKDGRLGIVERSIASHKRQAEILHGRGHDPSALVSGSPHLISRMASTWL